MIQDALARECVNGDVPVQSKELDVAVSANAIKLNV